MSSSKADVAKKTRREIANHNERRRMQNINTGFEQLRDVLPPIYDSSSDRLSKAAVLSRAHEYILKLRQQNQQMQMELMHHRSDAARVQAQMFNGYSAGALPEQVAAAAPPRSRGASISPPLSVSEGTHLITPPHDRSAETPTAAAPAVTATATATAAPAPASVLAQLPTAAAAPIRPSPSPSPGHVSHAVAAATPTPSRRHSAPTPVGRLQELNRGPKRRRISVAARPVEAGQNLDVMLQAIAALETSHATADVVAETPTGPGSSLAFHAVGDTAKPTSPKKKADVSTDGTPRGKPPTSRRLLLTAA